jgi:hypothetical protein
MDNDTYLNRPNADCAVLRVRVNLLLVDANAKNETIVALQSVQALAVLLQRAKRGGKDKCLKTKSPRGDGPSCHRTFLVQIRTLLSAEQEMRCFPDTLILTTLSLWPSKVTNFSPV